MQLRKWGFPKIRGTLLRVLILDSSILGFILGFPYFGKLPNIVCGLGLLDIGRWICPGSLHDHYSAGCEGG